GKFQPALFSQFLSHMGKSEEEYISFLKFQLASNILLSTIGEINFVPDAMAKSLYSHEHEQRVISYISVPKGSVASIPAASDADLNSFYEKNRDMFSVPEHRDISYLEISSNTVKPSAITEEQMKGEYENQKKAYGKQEA